jgi:two-component system chemotaxis sensor kinase CheA
MLSTEARPDGDSLEVIVFRHQGVDVGLIADEILDIVEEPLGSLQGADRPGLLGSAVVGGRVTDLVDLEAAAQWAGAGAATSLNRLEAALSGAVEY